MVYHVGFMDSGSVAECSAAHKSWLGVRGERQMGTVTGANARPALAQGAVGPCRARTEGRQARPCRTSSSRGLCKHLSRAPSAPTVWALSLLTQKETGSLSPSAGTRTQWPQRHGPGYGIRFQICLMLCSDSPSLTYREPLDERGGEDGCADQHREALEPLTLRLSLTKRIDSYQRREGWLW